MHASRFFGTILRIGRGIGTALGLRQKAEPTPQVSAFVQTSIMPAASTTDVTDAADVTEPAALETQMLEPEPEPAPAPVLAASPPPAPAAAPIIVQPIAIQPIAVQPPPDQPATSTPPTGKMRSIEEIRADLARLRQNAKERHAEMLAQRQTSFAATDLMDIAPPTPKPIEPRENTSETAFAATAFVDFGNVKSRRER